MAPDVRARETQGLLSGLGVDPSNAHFLGRDRGLRDGALHSQIERAWAGLSSLADSLGQISTIYTHAWEGGHSDHDVCHALSLALARHVSAERVGQVPCYRRPDSGIAPFSLLDPIAANGTPDVLTMSGAERRAMARCIVAYPSQWRSWLGLGPPLLTRITHSSAFPVQSVSEARLAERPHTKPLLYEIRGKLAFASVAVEISSFWTRRRGGI
jgi:LmbE family N-acetylglucosaminyl deacetylase